MPEQIEPIRQAHGEQVSDFSITQEPFVVRLSNHERFLEQEDRNFGK
jgi:hypothetical protein